MKKLFLLLIIPFLLTGCFDYNELSDLAIISGIGIDYQDDEFEVTFEILSTKKEGETSASSSSYNVTSKAKTIVEAFSRNGTLIDKVPYFEHLDVIVISETVAKNHLKEVGEYVIRTSKIRNETYLAIASNTSAKDVIESTSKEHPVAASFITNLLENNKNSASAAYYTPYTETLNSILTNGEDAMLSVVTTKEKEDNEKEIKLVGIGVFDDFKLKYIFDTEESAILNLLNNFDPETVFFKRECKNGTIVASVYSSKINIEPSNDSTNIKGNINVRINEDTCNDNYRKEEVYEELQQEFTGILINKMNNVLELLKQNHSNALNIGKLYYNKYRKPNYELWMTKNFTYELDVKINKKGLIFEVQR